MPQDTSRVLIFSVLTGVILYTFFSFAFPQIIIAPITDSMGVETVKSIVFKDVVQYNIAYLSLSVALIVLIGGLFAYFNLRPLQDSIRKQEENLEKEKGAITEFQSIVESNFVDVGIDIQKQLEDVAEKMRQEASALDSEINKQMRESIELLEKKLGASLKKADEKIQEIKKAAEDIEMESVWYQQYIWDAKGVHLNSLGAQVEYLELNNRYKRNSSISLCLTCISTTLDKLENSKGNAYGKKLLSRLTKVIDELDIKEPTRTEVITKAQEKLG